MDSNFNLVFEALGFIVLQLVIFTGIGLILSVIVSVFLWKKGYLQRSDYLRQGMTYMSVTVWVLGTGFAFGVYGGTKALEVKLISGYSEVTEVLASNVLPKIGPLIQKTLTEQTAKNISIEEASRLSYQSILGDFSQYIEEGEGEGGDGLKVFNELPGSETAMIWIFKTILKGMVLSKLDGPIQDDNFVFAVSLIENLDLENPSQSLMKSIGDVFFVHLKGFFLTIYLQLLVVYLIFTALFALEFWLYRNKI
jgi:hypothetical protein